MQTIRKHGRYGDKYRHKIPFFFHTISIVPVYTQ